MVSGNTVLALAGLAVTLKGKKRNKFLNITSGIVGDFIAGVGGGALINYIDQTFLNSQLSRLGMGIPSTNLSLNLTDAAIVAATTGLSTKLTRGSNLKRTLTVIAGKKLAENFLIIRPPAVRPAVGGGAAVTVSAPRVEGGLST